MWISWNWENEHSRLESKRYHQVRVETKKGKKNLGTFDGEVARTVCRTEM